MKLLEHLLRHPEALEPGLRFFDPLPESVRALGAEAGGPDPLGRPVLLRLAAPEEPDPAAAALDLAARAHADPGALSPWFARPREPRVFLVAGALTAEARGRLALLAHGCGLRAWLAQPDPGSPDRPRLLPLLVERLQHAVGEAPAAPPDCQKRLRRLLLAVGRIRPEIEIHGDGWPLVFRGARGACATLHRDGEDLLFVTERAARRSEVLRLADEEAVDRALDALLREQFAAAS